MKKFIFISVIAALTFVGCKVNETSDIKVTHIYLEPNEISALEVNATKQIATIVTPTSVKDKSVTWQSADEAIASVDADGNVTGKAVGTTTITAVSTQNGKIKSTCNVTVIKTVPIKAAKITGGNISLVVGAHQRLTYQITDPSNPDTATQEIVWSCDSTKYATVSDKGLVRAVKEGSAKVFISAGGTKLDSISVTVSKIPVDSLEIRFESSPVSGDTLDLAVDAEMQLEAVLFPDTASYKGVTWTSNKETVATVDKDGLVKAIASGYAEIIVKSVDNEAAADTCVVKVPMPEDDQE